MVDSSRVSAISSLSVTFLAMMTCALAAQVSPGARIRITREVPESTPILSLEQLPTTTQQLVGTVESIRSDSLRIRPQGTAGSVTIPVSSIKMLELHAGSQAKGGTGAAVGAVAGALIGFAVGLATQDKCEPGFVDLCDIHAVGHGMLGMGIGLVAGSGIGWLIGSQIHGDKWVPTPVKGIQLAPVSARSVGVSVSLHF